MKCPKNGAILGIVTNNILTRHVFERFFPQTPFHFFWRRNGYFSTVCLMVEVL